MYQVIRSAALGSVAFAVSCWMVTPIATARVKIPFKAPPSKPAPRRASTSQGASRGLLCAQSTAQASMSVKALVPESHYGLTSAERPTILAYLPETSATEVFFSIKSEDKRLHYETSLPISGKAGLMSVTLPKNAPALESGKHYQWFLAVKCNNELRPSSPFVDGWIQRVPADRTVSSVTAQSPSLQKAASLGAAGYWYDTLATLTQLKQQQPQNSEIAQSWRDVLEWTQFSEGELETLATSDVLQ
ncbi:MAG: DUF928 domain-containing protein [Thermosynechococcaceae cyanobacterium]